MPANLDGDFPCAQDKNKRRRIKLKGAYYTDSHAYCGLYWNHQDPGRRRLSSAQKCFKDVSLWQSAPDPLLATRN